MCLTCLQVLQSELFSGLLSFGPFHASALARAVIVSLALETDLSWGQDTDFDLR